MSLSRNKFEEVRTGEFGASVAEDDTANYLREEQNPQEEHGEGNFKRSIIKIYLGNRIITRPTCSRGGGNFFYKTNLLSLNCQFWILINVLSFVLLIFKNYKVYIN